MNAITVRPQWAYAMLHFGKRIENREFDADALVGKRIALHAGKHVGGAKSKPATARGFRELACDMIEAGYMAAPVWFKGEEPFLAWQSLMAKDMKSSNILLEADCPRGVVFATAILDRVECPPQEWGPPPWGHIDAYWWFLTEFKPLADPVLCSGQEGIWVLRGDTEEQVRKQL